MRSLVTDPYAIDSHKMQYHSERIAQWRQAKTIEEKQQVFPIYVEISPVGHCNHRCTFCAVDYIGYKVRSLDSSVLAKCLDSMCTHGVKSVMFAGEGEPMLHPDIIRLTRFAAELHLEGPNLDVAFTTNGTALTKKFVDEAMAGVSWIKVSMNGGSKTYAQIHQTKEADYERVWANIAYACSHNDTGRTVIGIQCVVLPENLQDLQELCERSKAVGCQYIVLKPYSQHKSSITKTYQEISYENEEIQCRIQQVRKFSDSNFKVIARTTAMEDWNAQTQSYSQCLSTPYFWAYIMATGDVYGCSAYLLNPEFCYGNINEQSFADIWMGPKRRAHLKAMETLDISKCRVNCRMNQVNKYLWDVQHPNVHANFI